MGDLATGSVTNGGGTLVSTLATSESGSGGVNLRKAKDTLRERVAQTAPQISKSCGVVSGPTYSPSGTLKPQIEGDVQSAYVEMNAKFAKDEAHDPSCCRVHQDVRWDLEYHVRHGGPPHAGFANGMPGMWYEDTDKTRTLHYGDRNMPLPGSKYTTDGQPDPLNGDTFLGYDKPIVAKEMGGAFELRQRVTNSCDGDALVATSDTIAIPWGTGQ